MIIIYCSFFATCIWYFNKIKFLNFYLAANLCIHYNGLTLRHIQTWCWPIIQLKQGNEILKLTEVVLCIWRHDVQAWPKAQEPKLQRAVTTGRPAAHPLLQGTRQHLNKSDVCNDIDKTSENCDKTFNISQLRDLLFIMLPEKFRGSI